MAVACADDSSNGDDSSDDEAGAGEEWPDLSGETLTFVAFGGDQQDAQTEAWLDPFEELTGVTFEQDSSYDNARISAQVESGNVIWDVNQNLSYFVNQQCGTLYEELENVDLSNIQEDLVSNDCGVPVLQLAVVIMYDEEAYPDEQPETWADFFDLERFPGTRSMLNYSTYNLEATLLADGVAPEDLYPLDVDRALDKLETIRDEIVWAESPAQLMENIVTGEADMIVSFSARGYTAAQTMDSLRAVWNQALFDWDNLAILKGSENKEAAEAFLSYIAQPEPQSRIAEIFPYGMTTVDADPELDELASEWFVNNPEYQSGRVNIDKAFWAENDVEINEQWADWVTR